MRARSEIVVLVSCVKLKQQKRVAAQDLYTSPLFRGMRQYAEAVADRWFILSAKHGLLSPTRLIGPYDQTLLRTPAAERRAWAQMVGRSIALIVPPPSRLVILAGAAYCRDLVPLLLKHFTVELPMQGMRMGPRLRWLKSQGVALSHVSQRGKSHEN